MRVAAALLARQAETSLWHAPMPAGHLRVESAGRPASPGRGLRGDHCRANTSGKEHACAFFTDNGFATPAGWEFRLTNRTSTAWPVRHCGDLHGRYPGRLPRRGRRYWPCACPSPCLRASLSLLYLRYTTTAIAPAAQLQKTGQRSSLSPMPTNEKIVPPMSASPAISSALMAAPMPGKPTKSIISFCSPPGLWTSTT